MKEFKEIKNDEGIENLIKECTNKSTLDELDRLAEETKFDIRMIPTHIKVFFINLKIGLMKIFKKK